MQARRAGGRGTERRCGSRLAAHHAQTAAAPARHSCRRDTVAQLSRRARHGASAPRSAQPAIPRRAAGTGAVSAWRLACVPPPGQPHARPPSAPLVGPSPSPPSATAIGGWTSMGSSLWCACRCPAHHSRPNAQTPIAKHPAPEQVAVSVIMPTCATRALLPRPAGRSAARLQTRCPETAKISWQAHTSCSAPPSACFTLTLPPPRSTLAFDHRPCQHKRPVVVCPPRAHSTHPACCQLRQSNGEGTL